MKERHAILASGLPFDWLSLQPISSHLPQPKPGRSASKTKGSYWLILVSAGSPDRSHREGPAPDLETLHPSLSNHNRALPVYLAIAVVCTCAYTHTYIYIYIHTHTSEMCV